MKRIISVLCCLSLLLALALPIGVSAEQTKIQVSINGKDVTMFRDIVQKGDSYLLPIKELMGKMGFFVEFDQATKSCISDDVNFAPLKVVPDSRIAWYDSVNLELDEQTIGLEDDVLVELRFIDMIYGVDFAIEDGKIKFSVSKKVKADEKEVVDSIDEYLKDIEPKNYTVKQTDIKDFKIYDTKLVSARMVEVDDAPGFTEAVEVDNLTEPGARYWDSQITIDSTESVSAGDVLVATFYARKIKCVDESGFSTFAATFEAIDTDWTKFFNDPEIRVDEGWTRFQYAFTVSKNLGIGGSHFCLRVGFRYQTVQFGGIEVVNYGKKADIEVMAPEKKIVTTYYGREDDALWREEALRRIEKYRKNDMTIKVVDEEGNPVKDATVKADMTRSEFLWGTAVNNENRVFYSQNTSVINQDIIKRLFNSVVLESDNKTTGFYEGNKDFKMESNAEAINFVRDNNMYFRSHAVLWDALKYFPAEDINENTTEEELVEYLIRHASRFIEAYGDTITEIDVLNEALNNTFFRDKFGWDYIAEVFRAVNEMAPNARLFYNETGIVGNESNWNATYRARAIIDQLQAAGAPVQGFGIQNHSEGFIYPQIYYNQLDYVAENLDYLAITEYDYLSKLPDNVEAERIEAEYLRDSLIMAYSHPKMTGFTMWGFYDAPHWRQNAPLYNGSLNPKPALKMWEKYVLDEWVTHEEALTDENGIATIRGHRGEYDITVEAGGRKAATTLVLTKDGENAVTAVIGKNKIDFVSSQAVAEVLPRVPVLRLVYERENYEVAYKKMYENLIENAALDNGDKADYILDEDNTAGCPISKSSYVMLNLKEPMNEGYILLKSTGVNQGQVRVFAITDDGEKQIYAGETTMGQLKLKFNGKSVKAIKIEGLMDIPSLIKTVKVSQKEDKGI